MCIVKEIEQFFKEIERLLNVCVYVYVCVCVCVCVCAR